MDKATKICEACGIEKPLDDFYLRKGRNTYHNRCKRCCIDNVKVVRVEKTTKICKHCGEEKPFSEYQKAGGGKWLQPYCKPCDKIRKDKHRQENLGHYQRNNKANYEANKERNLELGKKRYYEKHDEIREKAKGYRDKNKQKISERGKEYREKNKELLKERQKENWLKNRDKILAREKEKRKSAEYKKWKQAQDRAFRQKNPDKVKSYRARYKESSREKINEYHRNKNATDITWRLKKNIRSRIRFALKKWDTNKSDSAERLLGCTLYEFKHYFESLFKEGMTWELFMAGEIHIDHIKPCKLFDLTKEEEQRKCFNYTNCQPMWKSDNLKKGASYDKNESEGNDRDLWINHHPSRKTG